MNTEMLLKGKNLEIGDIVALDTNSEEELYIKAEKGNPSIVGVVNLCTPENDSQFINAIVVSEGFTNVKFLGKAKKGMEVVPSSIPGIGRKFERAMDDPTTILGFLVEDNDETNTKLVKMMVK